MCVLHYNNASTKPYHNISPIDIHIRTRGERLHEVVEVGLAEAQHRGVALLVAHAALPPAHQEADHLRGGLRWVVVVLVSGTTRKMDT
jgi:hypothetical protein